MKSIHLDELDRKIIDRLGQDARTSSRQISRELGVSEGAVRARVKRLHDAGAVRLAVITNAALNDRSPAFIWIDLSSQSYAKSVVDSLRKIEEITFVSIMFGRSDILAIVLSKNSEDISEFIHEKIDRINGIKNIEYTIGYSIIKHLYGKCAIVD